MIKDMIKLLPKSKKVFATILLFLASTNQTIAAQCSAVFPDGASTHSADGNISFDSNSKIIGSSNNQLHTTTITDNSGPNSNCSSADCSATGTASAVSGVSFQTGSRIKDVEMGWNDSVVVGSGIFSGNEFDDINPDGSSSVSITFSASQNEYFVDKLKLPFNSVLYLQAGGTYWFNQLTLGSQAEIIIQGSGTAIVYVNQDVDFVSPMLINSPLKQNAGDASKLVMYVFGNATLANDSTFTGSLYAQGDLTLISSSYLYGAVSAANITLNSSSTITYQSIAFTNTDFGDMCSDSAQVDDSCAVYFPDSIQGHTADSVLKFKESGQVMGDVDAKLTFPSLDDDDSDINTCNTSNCSVTGTYAPALTLPTTFVTSSSNVNITPSASDSAITIGPSGTFNTTQIKELIVDNDDNITFLASASEYIIDEAYFYGGTVTFNPGTYWFNELEIKGDAVVIINGAVTFYVNGQSKHLDIEGTAQVNLGGHAQNLAIVSYKEIHLKDDSQVNAVLYSDGHEIKLENNSRHIGSISSFGKVEIKKTATSTYADVSDVQIGDLCGVSQNIVPIIDYRFDELLWEGTAGEVIDSSGNTNNGIAVGGISTTSGKVCNAANIPGNDASTIEAVDTSGALDINIVSSGTISLWYRGNDAWNSGLSKRLFDASGSEKYFYAEITSSGKVIFNFESGDDSDYQMSTVDVFSVGSEVWTHLTFVWDLASKTVKIYVNGVEQSVTGSSGTSVPFNSLSTLYFGDNRTTYVPGESSADGRIDEVLVFDSVVSSAQIESIFTNQDAGNNYDGSARNCPPPPPLACDSGLLNTVGIRIDNDGNTKTIGSTTDALNIHAAWLSAGSPVSGSIANGTYNVFASETSTADRIDFGGSPNDFEGTLSYPGASEGVGDEQFLVHTSGTLSLPAGDYTIYVESDDGFSFIMNTLSGDAITFNKFGSSISGANNELRYENITANSNTGGSFTLTQDSLFDIAAIFFEYTGDDYLEISISNDIRTTADPSGYEVLRHGALNEKVKFGKACIPSIEVQAGRAILKNTANSPEFTSVCFDTPFSEVPRVFSLPTTEDDDDRLALRIRNVTTTGFDIAQVEPPRITDLDLPAGNVSQTVDFLAIPEGDYHLDGAAMMRVGSVSTKAFRGNKAGGSQSWVTISTADLAFSQTPAIIASIQTMNNETNPFPISTPFLATTVSSVGNTNFKLALERGETNSGDLGNNETIGFMAITPGSGELTNDISYESFLTDNSITGINSCQVSNLNTYNSNPLVIASQNTRAGANGGWLKRCSISTSSAGFSIVEDQADDAEGNHISEKAGGIALGGTFTDMTCNTQDVHHYRIEHDTQGFTCEAETVTIKACADANCDTSYDQDTTITLSDLGLAGDGWINGNEITIPAGTDTPMPITLSVTDEGSVTFSKTSANPNASLRCFSGSTETCEMTFSNDGFEFFGTTTAIKALTDQTAETNFSDVNIRAVRNDAGVCKPLLNGPQDITFTYNCEDPSTCLTPLAGIPLNSTPSDDQSGTLSVTFASNGTAPLSMLNYADVGRLNLTVAAQIDNVTVTSGLATIDIYPDELRVSVQPSNISNTTSTYVADVPFDLTIGAYGMQGGELLNYQPGNLQMFLKRITPDAASTIEGTLTLNSAPHTTALTPSYQSTTIPTFVAGKYRYTANYDEVGEIQINFKDEDYLGNTIDSAGALNLGRFIPAYFEITQITNPSLNNTRSGSSYIGEYIPFSESLVYQITAKNASGQTTSNYGGDHWKLSFNASHVSFADNTLSNGEILGDISSNGTESDYDGQATYSITQPASTEFGIYTSPLARIPKTHIPINPIDMSFTPVITTVAANAATSVIRTIADSDGVCFKRVYPSACQVFDSEVIQGAQARYGRLVIESTYGPEQEDLSVPIKVEYFINNQWLTNQDDNSTSVAFDLSAGQLLLNGEATLKGLVGNISSIGELLGGKSVGSQLRFSAPNVTGHLVLELIPNATGIIWSDYLNHDWDGDSDIDDDDKPSATVTFGQFRGNDKIIHWREVLN
jgi:hypothetical protein